MPFRVGGKLSNQNLIGQGVGVTVTLVGSFVFYRTNLLSTFDKTQARLLGLRPRLARIVLLSLIAISVVASFQPVGNPVIFAFLVGPPAAAVLIVQRVPLVTVMGIVIGVASVVIGSLISFHSGTAVGATMALVSVCVFFVVRTVTAIRRAIVA